MNILVVSLGIKEDGISGGEAQVIFELYKVLQKNKHKIIHLTRRTGKKQPCHENRSDLEIYRFWSPAKNSKLYFFAPLFYILQSFFYTKYFLTKKNINIVNYHHPVPSVGVELALNKKIPRILTFHAPRFKEVEYELNAQKKYISSKIKSKVLKMLEKFIINRSDEIIVLSNFMKNEVKLLSPEKQLIHKIPAGVDAKKFHPIEKDDKFKVRKKLNLPLQSLILLTVRRLVPRMGLENLLEAAVILKCKGIDFKLFIIGKGFLKNVLEKKIIEYDLEKHVVLLGYISDEQLPLFYQASDLFIISTAKLEGFGLVILEALATNLPVIGTPIGAITEVLANFNVNLISKSEKSNDIADLIFLAATEPNKIKLKQNYFSIVNKKFSWEKVALEYERIFSQTLNENKKI